MTPSAPATPAELAERYTDLDEAALAHLQRLMGSWSALADLSFSDLLLVAPVRGSGRSHLVVLGQIRPSTAATILVADLVGQMVAAEDWPLVVEALEAGDLRGGISVVPLAPPAATTGHRGQLDPQETGEVPAVPPEARIECIPVRHRDDVVAVVVRVGPIEGRRRIGRLERVYRGLFDRLAAMVAAGQYPFPGEDVSGEDVPRVGDGLLLVDSEGRIVYASPNAMNALHRMGVSVAPEGRTLPEIGVEADAVERSLASGQPVLEEVERRPDVAVLLHCTPLLADGDADADAVDEPETARGVVVTGGMVLLRDVTDIRRLDRLLLSKDAAIREVHHRVKNNLQTISSLLRLQARRLGPGEGADALRESERRVRSIALVHEILSREPGDQVPFEEIVARLVQMAKDSALSGPPVVISVQGDLGELPVDLATPLALVLAEVLQNAIEHAFGPAEGEGEQRSAAEGSGQSHDGLPQEGQIQEGHVDIVLVNDGFRLIVQVRDDGRGLPEGFDLEHTTSLGLSIVRDLVTTQLGGSMVMEGGSTGTVVAIDIPVQR